MITKYDTMDCFECEDEGVVSTDQFDSDSGQMMSGVGEMKCICQYPS